MEGDSGASFRGVPDRRLGRTRLLDLSSTFAETGINIPSAPWCTRWSKDRFVEDTQSLKAAITRLSNIGSVFDAYRVTPTG
jgi:hypothetical protein